VVKYGKRRKQLVVRITESRVILTNGYDISENWLALTPAISSTIYSKIRRQFMIFQGQGLVQILKTLDRSTFGNETLGCCRNRSMPEAGSVYRSPHSALLEKEAVKDLFKTDNVDWTTLDFETNSPYLAC
jgi:hypothetical protein